MMRLWTSLLFFPVSVAVILAADKDGDKKLTPIPAADLKRTTPIVYETDVAPIFKAKCQVCHSGKITDGDFDLGTYASLMKGGKRGPAVIPGKHQESLLWLFSSHNKGPIMPPKSEENPLTPEEVAILKLWIDQGAKGPVKDVRERPKVVLNLPPILVKPVRAVAIRPDKSVIAASRGNQVHIFDAKTGEFKTTYVDPELKTAQGQPANAAHISLVDAMAYSPDGKILATGSFQEVVLWDGDKGTPLKRIGGFADRVVALDFSPDGKYLATGGGAPTEDGEIKIFDTATWQLVVDIKGGHSDTVFGVRFHPEGKMLATSAADKFMKVFEVPSGKLLKSFEGHTHHVMDVGWTPNGKFLVTAGADNQIKVWDFEKGEKVRDINGHTKQVTRLSFFGKNPHFLTAGGDATVRLWNADNGGAMRQFGGNNDFVYTVHASDDGGIVVAGGEDGIVRLYNGANGQIVKEMLPPGAEPKKDEPKK
jgi:WD40 repeat protein